MNSLWFSLYTHDDYVSTEEPFVDISNSVGIKNLEQNYLVIFNELQKYLETNNLNNHFNITMVDKAKTWKVQGLRGWCRNNYIKQKHFPQTMTILNAIPNITSISFNLLEPQSKIKPHNGDTNGIIRCHLGLKIPDTAPNCALQVKNKISAWQEGKVVAFIDAYKHEAWNLSDETRIILLFDILKPEFVSQKNKICGTVHASLVLQRFGNRWPKIYKINRKIFKVVLFPLICFLRMKFPLVDKLKKRKAEKIS